jgi:hypothetical protein
MKGNGATNSIWKAISVDILKAQSLSHGCWLIDCQETWNPVWKGQDRKELSYQLHDGGGDSQREQWVGSVIPGN